MATPNMAATIPVTNGSRSNPSSLQPSSLQSSCSTSSQSFKSALGLGPCQPKSHRDWRRRPVRQHFCRGLLEVRSEVVVILQSLSPSECQSNAKAMSSQCQTYVLLATRLLFWRIREVRGGWTNELRVKGTSAKLILSSHKTKVCLRLVLLVSLIYCELKQQLLALGCGIRPPMTHAICKRGTLQE